MSRSVSRSVRVLADPGGKRSLPGHQWSTRRDVGRGWGAVYLLLFGILLGNLSYGYCASAVTALCRRDSFPHTVYAISLVIIKLSESHFWCGLLRV